MKSIVVLINRMGIGGAERLIVEEINEFVRRGYSVSLITFSPEAEHSFMSSVPSECTRHLIRIKGISDVHGVRELAKFLKNTDPDMVFTHLWFANTLGRIAARMGHLQHRVVSFEHNVYDKVKTWKQFLADRFLQKWCAKIIAVSQSVKESLVRHGIRAHRIVVIPNAVDTARFENAPASNIRDELGLGSTFIYLHAGRLTEQKGVDTLLEAFARLEDGALLIAGDGEDRPVLEVQACSLGIAPRVFFLGVRNDIPSLMKAADCFVLASRWEGHPMVAIEAMAAGAAIIVADFPTGLDIFHDRINSIIVPRGNQIALAHAMAEVRTNVALCHSLSEQALSDSRKFSVKKHAESVLSCLGAQV